MFTWDASLAASLQVTEDLSSFLVLLYATVPAKPWTRSSADMVNFQGLWSL